jgi:3D (Asp-Asp-Asp) domain-containing protein
MKHITYIPGLLLLTFSLMSLSSCTSTTTRHSLSAGVSAVSPDRSAAVFRKEKPATSPLPSGCLVFAQASKKTISTGSNLPPVKEPKLQVASQTSPSTTKPRIPEMVGSQLLVRTTAYCHKESDSLKYGRLNAAGGTLQYGASVRSAAADWSRFPLGTRFRIEGEPYEYVIDDYGSALVGTNTIDIYKPTFTAMNQWGVRRVPIQIIEWGCFNKSHEILDTRKHVRDADHVRQMLRDIERRYMSSYSTAGASVNQV